MDELVFMDPVVAVTIICLLGFILGLIVLSYMYNKQAKELREISRDNVILSTELTLRKAVAASYSRTLKLIEKETKAAMETLKEGRKKLEDFEAKLEKVKEEYFKKGYDAGKEDGSAEGYLKLEKEVDAAIKKNPEYVKYYEAIFSRIRPATDREIVTDNYNTVMVDNVARLISDDFEDAIAINTNLIKDILDEYFTKIQYTSLYRAVVIEQPEQMNKAG